jgi:DNA-binding MarR family transcriptional regulator
MAENRQLFLNASTTAQYVAQIVELQLRPMGVPPFLVAILTHIRDLEPVSPTEISRASGSSISTLRDNVQRLLDRKLVRRVPNPADGRSYLLRLTARGRAVVEAADPALLEAYRLLERRLPRPRADYERALAELNEALERSLAELAADALRRRGGRGSQSARDRRRRASPAPSA